MPFCIMHILAVHSLVLEYVTSRLHNSYPVESHLTFLQMLHYIDKGRVCHCVLCIHWQCAFTGPGVCHKPAYNALGKKPTGFVSIFAIFYKKKM